MEDQVKIIDHEISNWSFEKLKEEYLKIAKINSIDLSSPNRDQVPKLNPPPLPIIEKEKFTEKINAYLKPSLKKKYELLLEQKNLKWSEAIRQGLKLLLENNGNLGVNVIDQITKLLGTYKKPSKYVKDAINLEWNTPKEGAIEGKAQSLDHAKFMQKIIPDLKKMLSLENKGLEEVPLEILKAERPKADSLHYNEWKKKVEERKNKERLET